MMYNVYHCPLLSIRKHTVMHGIGHFPVCWKNRTIEILTIAEEYICVLSQPLRPCVTTNVHISHPRSCCSKPMHDPCVALPKYPILKRNHIMFYYNFIELRTLFM